MIYKNTCPCCKGKTFLEMLEIDDVTAAEIITHPLCTHCHRGKISAEVPEEETL